MNKQAIAQMRRKEISGLPGLLNTEIVGAWMGLKPVAVSRMFAKGELRGAVKIGKSWQITREAFVENFKGVENNE